MAIERIHSFNQTATSKFQFAGAANGQLTSLDVNKALIQRNVNTGNTITHDVMDKRRKAMNRTLLF